MDNAISSTLPLLGQGAAVKSKAQTKSQMHFAALLRQQSEISKKDKTAVSGGPMERSIDGAPSESSDEGAALPVASTDAAGNRNAKTAAEPDDSVVSSGHLTAKAAGASKLTGGGPMERFIDAAAGTDAGRGGDGRMTTIFGLGLGTEADASTNQIGRKSSGTSIDTTYFHAIANAPAFSQVGRYFDLGTIISLQEIGQEKKG